MWIVIRLGVGIELTFLHRIGGENNNMAMIGSRNVAEVDYKADAGDILYVLKEEYGNEVPAFFSENMKSLAENYAK